MAITALEKRALIAIRDSEFHNGSDPINDWVWTDCVSDEVGGGKQFSGVSSSLQQKGFAKFEGTGRDAVCCITQSGFDALNEAA